MTKEEMEKVWVAIFLLEQIAGRETMLSNEALRILDRAILKIENEERNVI